MKKGFTLLELMIVVIIVGILATLGMTQYLAVIERSRSTEARQILGMLRSMCAGKYLETKDANACTKDNLSIGTGIPEQCNTSHYFKYSVTTTISTATFNASRCDSDGKLPQGNAGNFVSLTTNYIGGDDTWQMKGY